MDREAIGEYIKELRKKRGLTYAQLGELAGLSDSYISRIEKGKIKTPSADTLGKLASHLGVTKQHLLERFGYIEPAVQIDEIDEIDEVRETHESRKDDVSKELDVRSRFPVKVDLAHFLSDEDLYDIYYGGRQISKRDRKILMLMLFRMALPDSHYNKPSQGKKEPEVEES
jgi:transcriptional regulator with XRE-family HTH domain